MHISDKVINILRCLEQSCIRRILLDTGDDNVPEYITTLKEVLLKEKVELEHILISHWHHDHIGGVGQIYQDIKPACQVSKIPCTSPPDEPLPHNLEIAALKHHQEIKTEGATLRVIHTPGHTTDHMVLWLEEEKALFSADCILGEGTAVFEDLHDYMLSLKKILGLQPTLIYTGHGPVVEDPLPKISYYIHHREEREEQILDVLQQYDKSFTPMELVEIIYTETPKILYPAASQNVLQHLQKLQKENIVTSTNDKYQLVKLKSKQ